MKPEFLKNKIERFEPNYNLDTVRDGRGGIFTWVPPESILEWNMLVYNPSKVRGNHFHKEFTEYFMVVSGYGTMVFVDENGNEKIFHLSMGQGHRTPKNVPHAFYAIEQTTAMASLTKTWDSCDEPITHQKLL